MKCEYIPFIDLLSNIIDNRGRTCPTQEIGIPLIATNCITNDTLYPTYEKIRYVSEETYSSWFRGHPKPGDLIFVTKGSPGHVCMVPDPIDFCIAQDMVAIRADPTKIYPKYLFAILRSNEIQRQIENLHVGTLIPHFKKGDFDKLLIPVVDQVDQKIIGDMYFDLSAKIELNRRMNQTLEEIAQALFKEWFVDNPEAEGWEKGSILNFANLLSGGTPKTSEPEYWNGDINWVSAKDVGTAGGLFLLDTDKKITQVGINNSNTKLLPARTTIVTARGTVGAYCLLGRPMTMNQTNYGLKSKEGFGDYFVYFILKNIVNQLQQQSYGTIFDTITTRTFQESVCVQPSKEIVQNFEIQVKPLMDAILNNQEQSITLAKLRDSLLPKLMRGEIRIR